MGRFAVPSALAIGSIAPDLWYFVPFVNRVASHSIAGLFWFCVPVGLVSYLVFHWVLKEPLIALLSPRLASFSSAGLPPARWHAVVLSLLAGSITHLAWDALTHSEAHRWLQHASTLAGSAILAWWSWRKLRRAPIAAHAPRLSPLSRGLVFAGVIGVSALAALWSADGVLAYDRSALRHLLRTAGIGALQGLGVALLAYCLAFQRKMP
jgi:hypothetical protein